MQLVWISMGSFSALWLKLIFRSFNILTEILEEISSCLCLFFCMKMVKFKAIEGCLCLHCKNVWLRMSFN